MEQGDLGKQHKKFKWVNNDNVASFQREPTGDSFHLPVIKL